MSEYVPDDPNERPDADDNDVDDESEEFEGDD